MRVVLVRHTETVEGALKLAVGNSDVELSDQGKLDVPLVAADVARRVFNEHVSISTAPRIRTRILAQAIAASLGGGVDIREDEDLTEVNLGDLTLHSLVELRPYMDGRTRIPNGEAAQEYCARVVRGLYTAVISATQEGAQTLIVPTSNGFIQAAKRLVDPSLPLQEFSMGGTVRNGEVCELQLWAELDQPLG